MVTKEPFVPPVVPTTTTTELFTTTTYVCVVAAADMTFGVVPEHSAGVPAVGFFTSLGGKAKLLNIKIIAAPGVGSLTLRGVVQGANALITPQDNGRVIYNAPAGFTGTTFTYQAVTNCGTSSTKTATITLVELPDDCNCNSTTTSSTSTTTT